MKMPSNIWLAVIVLAVAGAAGYGLSRINGTEATRATSTATVALLSERADPAVIALTQGGTVEFAAKDGRTHNIVQGSGDNEVHQELGQDVHDHPVMAKESGDFGPGQGYQVTFKKVGTFTFHDHLNPKISVTVIVYEKR